MQTCVRKLVAGLTLDLALREDLFQVCLVHLWEVEGEKPGRTNSWYLQSCRFEAQHWLAAGRSLDSPKRARGDARISIDQIGAESVLNEYNTNGEVFETICFRDSIASLGSRLKPKERAVLDGLADGCLMGEVAARSGISYPTALKYRRRIADLAVTLGMVPPSSSPKSIEPRP